MYLRRSVVRRGQKTHTYWRLVRSVRQGSKTRQVTVAMLGELDDEGRARASALAKHFLADAGGQRYLFEDDTRREPIRVFTDRLRVERARCFGDVFVAWTLWRALGLDDFIEKACPAGTERVRWSDVISILVLARFCEPSSELHIAEDWYGKTALDDILGVRADLVHSERLYRGLDRLLLHKDALQRHLKDRLGKLFSLDYDLMLYDVTSTYFEGTAASNAKAQRGHSRDSRPDCKQVCIALVVTREGYPVGYEVFAGNRVDVTTVEQVVSTMEARYGKARRVWVMDRGMTSEDNLEWMRAENRQYLVGAPRSELRKFERDLTDKSGWAEVRDGLEVKLCEGRGGKETFILCRSTNRREKEAAMHERFTKRIEAALSSLRNRIERSKRKLDKFDLARQIGRIQERNSRAAGRYEIRLADDPKHPSGVKLVVNERKEWTDWAALSEGAYLLRSNVKTWSAEELWQTYIQLTQAEAAFRIQKSELSIRPIWHQREDRVEAHILVCFIAFAMWKTLEGWMKQARIGTSVRTLLDDLKRLVSIDVVLPTEANRELRLRCVAQPDKDLAYLLDRMGIAIPRRLKIAPGLAPNVVPT
jgi:transposase